MSDIRTETLRQRLGTTDRGVLDSIISGLRAENEALRHDIERHVAIAANLAGENEALRRLLNNTDFGSHVVALSRESERLNDEMEALRVENEVLLTNVARWREDSMSQTATIQRLGEAALDRDKVDALRASAHEHDLAQLRAEVEFKAALIHELLPYQDRAVKAEVENEALRQDALRYRLLRSRFRRQTAYDRYDGAMWDVRVHDSKCVGLDAAIDAAMKEKGLT